MTGPSPETQETPDRPDRPDLLIGGLSLQQMIAAPLVAATEASARMAEATAEFIDAVGSKGDAVHEVSFCYDRPVEVPGPEAGQQVVMEPMRVTLPLLAMVPIPTLRIDTLHTSFTAEVRSAHRESEQEDVATSTGPPVPTVVGRPTTHREHVRSSDKTAKYSFDLTASSGPPPEALARVLDLMAQAVAPRPNPPTEPR